MVAPTSIEPIAVVGLSFRLPGGIHDVQDLWELLESGERAWIDIPKQRCDEDVSDHTQQKIKKIKENHGS